MRILYQLASGFLEGWHAGCHTSRASCNRKDKAMREHLSDRQVDEMVEETFPASDPSALY